jgi:serine/threonine protein kinase
MSLPNIPEKPIWQPMEVQTRGTGNPQSVSPVMSTVRDMARDNLLPSDIVRDAARDIPDSTGSMPGIEVNGGHDKKAEKVGKSRNSIFDEPTHVWQVKPAPTFNRAEFKQIKIITQSAAGMPDTPVVPYHTRYATSLDARYDAPCADTIYTHSRHIPSRSTSSFDSLDSVDWNDTPHSTTHSMGHPSVMFATMHTDNSMQQTSNSIQLTDNSIQLSPGVSIANSTPTPGLLLSYLAQKRNLLGQGRYAQVFSGTFRFENANLQPCAVKKIRRDDDSKRVGVTEVNILRWLHTAIPPIGLNSQSTLVNSFPELASKSTNHIVQLLAVAEESTQETIPRLLIVLPLARGTLADYVKENNLGIVTWRRWALQLTSAVEYCHSRGVIHHDIKPHNVLITDTLDVVLSDFGNAAFVSCPPGISPTLVAERCLENPIKKFSSNDWIDGISNFYPFIPTGDTIIPPLLFDGLGRGTDAYSPPELWQLPRTDSPAPSPVTPMSLETPSGIYSYPVDVYSLALTLLFAIVGVEPFEPRPLVVGSPREHLRSTSMSSMSGARLILAIKKGVWETWVEREILSKSAFRFINNEELDGEIVHLFKKCLDKRPDSRPTASHLLSALQTI